MALEDVQAITDGANVIASLMNQGLSREAAEKRLTGELRAAQREQYRQRQAREGNREEAEAFLAQADRDFQTKGVEIDQDGYLDIDGEYQEVIRDDYGDVKAVRRPQDDDQTYTDDEKERFGVAAQSYDPNERDAAFDQQRGRTVYNPKTDKRTWREGGKTYSDVRFVSRERRGPDYANPSLRQLNVNSRPEMAVPPEVRDRVFTLEDEIKAERRQSRRDVAKGAKKDGVDLVAALRNEVLAEKEAREIASLPANAAAGIGQANLDKIQNILNLGTAKNKGGIAEDVLSVVPYVDPRTFDDAVRYVGPAGETVGYGRADVGFLGDLDIAGVDPALEAASLTKNQQWMIDNLRLQNTGQTTVSDNLKPVSVSGELALLADRLNAVGYGDQVVGGIRSSSDFDQAIANFVTRAKQNGDQLFSYNTETGKNVAMPDPGVAEVLNKLHYTQPEASRLANALYAITSAEVAGVQPRKVTNGNIQMDAGRELDGGDAPIARLGGNEKIGRGKARRNVRGELSKLGSPDAQQPFIGAVEGEGVPRARFLSAKAAGMSPQERIDAYGEEKGGIANEVERRAKADRTRREERLIPKPDLYATQQRAQDAQFEAKGREIQQQLEAKEIEELRRLQTLGANRSDGPFLGTNNRVIPAVRAGRRLEVPQESQLNQDPRFRSQQPIQAAPVPASITPQPGAGTGNQSAPSIDAGRGGWMGGGNGGRIVNPYQPEEPAGALVKVSSPTDAVKGEAAIRSGYNVPEKYDVVQRYSKERQRSDELGELRRQLSAINNPAIAEYENRVQGPTMRTEPRNKQQRTDAWNNFKIKNRRAGLAAAGAGATAGLAALISGERQERDQEAYQ